MKAAVKRKRTYHSERRQEQAQATRERILDAALNRFGQDGYVRTTMVAIAEQARVATPTVYATFSTKAAILGELLARAIFGGEAPWSSAAERSWFRALTELPSADEILRRHVSYVVGVNRRVAPLQRIAEGAADADPDIASLWRRVLDQRMHGQRSVADLLAARGGLAPALSARHAADIIWAMTDARLYQSFVLTRRWSETAFEEWLFATLRSALLGGAPPRR